MSDTKWLTKRGGNAWHAILGVPRKLRPTLGKSHLLKSLHTDDLTIARSRRHAALAEFNRTLDTARRQIGAGEVMGAAMQWRDHLRRIEQGDLSGISYSHVKGDDLRRFALGHATGLVQEDAQEVATKYGPAVATAFQGVALGVATPLAHHLASWLKEGGTKGPLNIRTQGQLRSAVQRFGEWCQQANVPLTIEAVSKDVAGRYVTEAFVAHGADPATTNKHVSSLSSYWRWLVKRTATTVNPWAGQGQSKANGRNGTDRAKRPFTDAELATLLRGDADQELADVIRVAALSGLRLEEVYRLRVADCAHGIFNIRQAKTAAGVRVVPVHTELTAIVDRRTKGKSAESYLFHEAGALRPGRERSMAISKRFGRYRQSLGVEDREPGRRHSRIDFHSLRRWFITRARNGGIDQATVAAVVGHETGSITDDTYSSGPEMAQRRRCVEAVRLPA